MGINKYLKRKRLIRRMNRRLSNVEDSKKMIKIKDRIEIMEQKNSRFLRRFKMVLLDIENMNDLEKDASPRDPIGGDGEEENL